MFVDLPWENSWATVVNQAANCLWELLELLLVLLLLLLPQSGSCCSSLGLININYGNLIVISGWF